MCRAQRARRRREKGAMTEEGVLGPDALETIAVDEPARRHFPILGHRMAAVVTEAKGDGPTIVALHGNPTSSYLWRNVIPHLAPFGRVVAPDLIGMGDSDKLPGADPDRYAYAVHRRFLDAFLDEVVPEGPVVLVLHDWGTALGIDWARRHPRRVAAIAYMEGLVAPLSWADWPEAARGIFAALRGPEGEKLILEQNLFVESILPAGVMRRLRPAEMAVYRRPFARAGEDRRPTLSWPRAVPFDGEPAGTHGVLVDNLAFLKTSRIPKLLLLAEPGVVLTGRVKELCLSFPAQQAVTVAGLHFLQEDSPHAIGRAVAAFLEDALA